MEIIEKEDLGYLWKNPETVHHLQICHVDVDYVDEQANILLVFRTISLLNEIFVDKFKANVTEDGDVILTWQNPVYNIVKGIMVHNKLMSDNYYDKIVINPHELIGFLTARAFKVRNKCLHDYSKIYLSSYY